MRKFCVRNSELSNTDYGHDPYPHHHLIKGLEITRLYFADSKSSYDLNYLYAFIVTSYIFNIV